MLIFAIWSSSLLGIGIIILLELLKLYTVATSIYLLIVDKLYRANPVTWQVLFKSLREFTVNP